MLRAPDSSEMDMEVFLFIFCYQNQLRPHVYLLIVIPHMTSMLEGML